MKTHLSHLFLLLALLWAQIGWGQAPKPPAGSYFVNVSGGFAGYSRVAQVSVTVQ